MLNKNDESRLLSLIGQKILWCGIGNDFRGDDAAGPLLMRELINKGVEECADLGISPENAIDKAVKLGADCVLFIDAADFGCAVGEWRIIPLENISQHTISTHYFPLSAISAIIKEETGADSIFLGVQMRQANFGERLSKEVLRSVKNMAQWVWTHFYNGR